MKYPSLHAVASRSFGKLATCLILGVAVLPQSARSDYASAALAKSPAAFWQLNETGDPSTGTLPAVDSGGSGLDGTYGTAAYNGYYGYLAPQPPTYPGFATGQGALYCVGATNSVISIPPLNLHTNAVTIAMWINPGTYIPAFTGLLMNRTSTGDAAGFGFGGQLNGDGMAALGYTWNTNAAGTYNFNSGLYPVLGAWQLVALVVQSNSATIYQYYIDPNTSQPQLLSAVNSIAHTPQGFSGGATFLGSDVLSGASPDGTRAFTGYISSVAVYSSALSQSDITELFAAGVGVAGFAPSITGQPRSQYVLEGSPVVLSATGIGGTAPFTYTWQLDGADIDTLSNSTNFSGINSNVLNILSASTNEEGTYRLRIVNSIGTTYSSNATVTIQAPSLVGRWFTNNTLADLSGYTPAGTHDGYAVGGGLYEFTNDVPTGQTGQSLLLSSDSGIAIINSSTIDAGYTNTFDERINNAMTVACWAKGWPAGWNPFVSKFGESGLGWQLRQDGQNGISPCWTIRGAGGVTTKGTSVYGNPEDLSARDFTFGDDGSWHFYVGTYDAATGERNLYVDGVLGASQVSNNVYALSPVSYLCLGARSDATGLIGNFFNGQLYDVRLYNYAISSSDVLDMYGVNPPTITLQPQSIGVFEGSTAQLNANASGTPPLEYKWQFNGTDIDLLPNSTNFTGINSNVLTVLTVTTNEVGTYQLTVTSTLGYGTAVSSNANVTIVQPSLVGEWFNGSSSLADVSGYTPAGTHDGYVVGGANYMFTNDVPPGMTGQSIILNAGVDTADTAIAINNSATTDPGYTNTFDGGIHSAMTVAFWAKGFPASWSWNPLVSKYGENGQGWQFREGNGAGRIPCWTVRGGGWAGCTLIQGAGPDWAKTGSLEDLHAGTGVGDGVTYYDVDNNWHFYAATFSTEKGTRYIYIDGQVWAQTTNEPPYTLSPDAHVAIGAREDPSTGTFSNFSSEPIFDVRIYNYDLSLEEVVALMPDPVITVEPPQSLNAYVGGTVTLATTVGVTEPITNQWQFNGANLVDGAFNGAIISGANSTTLTIANVTPGVAGVYRLVVSNPKGTATSKGTTINVLSPAAPPSGNLVGNWLTGAENLADTSGYMPAGTHDGFGVTGNTATPSSNYRFTNDVPTQKTGQSLWLYSGDTAIAISNSSLYEMSYTNTFDDMLTNMTVVFWAKGWPGTWNPFVSKYGESGFGWQMRRNGGSSPCWTIRGTGGNEDMSGNNTMSNDGLWHLYAGTYDGTAGTRSLYVDGVLRASQSGEFPYVMDPYSYLCLGGRDSGGDVFGNYFVGQLYDVRIYNTALSEAQVNWLMPTNTAVLLPEFGGPPVVSGSQFVLTWSNGTLQQATNVAGPWTDTGATSPYTNDVTTAPQLFFRLMSSP